MSQQTTHSVAAMRAAERIMQQADCTLKGSFEGPIIRRPEFFAAIIDAEIAPLVEALRAALNEMEQSEFFYLKPAEEQARAALRQAEGGGSEPR